MRERSELVVIPEHHGLKAYGLRRIGVITESPGV